MRLASLSACITRSSRTIKLLELDATGRLPIRQATRPGDAKPRARERNTRNSSTGRLMQLRASGRGAISQTSRPGDADLSVRRGRKQEGPRSDHGDVDIEMGPPPSPPAVPSESTPLQHGGSNIEMSPPPSPGWPAPMPAVSSDAIDAFLMYRGRERMREVEDLRASADRLPFVRPRDVPGLAYLHARKALGDPITGHDLRRLKQADETVAEVRRILRWGRGNVDADVADTNSENLFRANAGVDLADRLVVRHPEEDADMLRAAVAYMAGAGYCEEYAWLALALHLPKLEPGDVIMGVASLLEDHMWVEVRSPDQRRLIIDAWCESPAHFSADNETHVTPLGVKLEIGDEPVYGDPGGGGNTVVLHSVHYNQAQDKFSNMLRMLERLRQREGEAFERSVDARTEQNRGLSSDGTDPNMWPPTASIAPHLADAAAEVMAPRSLPQATARRILSGQPPPDAPLTGPPHPDLVKPPSRQRPSQPDWRDSRAGLRQELAAAFDLGATGRPSSARHAAALLDFARNLRKVRESPRLDAIGAFLMYRGDERSREVEDLRASADRLPSVRPDDVPGLAYVHARKALGDPITGHDLTRLKEADETVAEVRRLLRWGRGNVDADVAGTHRESLVRVKAVRAYANRLVARYPEEDKDMLHAAVSILAGAGNCTEHSYVAMALHLRKIEPGDVIKVVRSRLEDHGWVEVHNPHRRTLIIDAWSESPAHFAEDNEAHVTPLAQTLDLRVLGQRGGGSGNTRDAWRVRYDEAQARHWQLHRILDTLRRKDGKDFEESVDDSRERDRSGRLEVTWHTWPPTASIASQLADAAAEVMAPRSLPQATARRILSGCPPPEAPLTGPPHPNLVKPPIGLRPSQPEWRDNRAGLRQELLAAFDLGAPGRPSLARHAGPLLDFARNLRKARNGPREG